MMKQNHFENRIQFIQKTDMKTIKTKKMVPFKLTKHLCVAGTARLTRDTRQSAIGPSVQVTTPPLLLTLLKMV